MKRSILHPTPKDGLYLSTTAQPAPAPALLPPSLSLSLQENNSHSHDDTSRKHKHKNKNNKPRSYSSSNHIHIHIIILGIGFLMGHLHGRRSMTGTVECPSTSTGSTLPVPTPPIPIPILKNNDGWHSIDVFYGKTDRFEQMLPPNQLYFSQAHQEQAMLAVLGQYRQSSATANSAAATTNSNSAKKEKVVVVAAEPRNGYFVDLAANDATILSNTYYLEKHLNWTGLCIEPNYWYWYNLTNYRPNCQIVAAVVGGDGGGNGNNNNNNNNGNGNNNKYARSMDPIDFLYEAGDHGGIVGMDFDNKAKTYLLAKSKPAYTVSLLEIFRRYQVPPIIDYLNFDVEGAEEFILKSFPLDEYQIRVLTVERASPSVQELLTNHGYVNLVRLSRWGDTLWAHESILVKTALTNNNNNNDNNGPGGGAGGIVDLEFYNDLLKEYNIKEIRAREKALKEKEKQGQTG